MTWQDVDPGLMERLGITVERVNWFSTYQVHHRVAEAFRKGRAFLLGDAAHIHSPVGGQGMNTGIGDAVNLAWKLAAVVQGAAPPALLDTYEPERIAFARRLVATTDRAFTAVTRPSAVARFIRTEVVPRIMPPLFAQQGRAPLHVPHDLANGDQLPAQQPERRTGRLYPRRRSPAMGSR